LSSEKKLFIHEKAKTQYIGKRIIPLSDLAYLTIKYFYNIKEKLSLNYYEPILFIEDKVEELKQDTCLKWLENKKEILLKTYSSDFYNNLKIFIYSVDFDIGRYVFESYAHNKFKMKQEFIDAFLNHSESGTEDQAMYNVFNNDIYTAEVLKVIHQIEKDYLPNYSTILNEIKGL
jgi:ribosome biogenesis GTPase A